MKQETLIPVQNEPSLADGHKIALPGGEWCLWKWVAVRGAGFPASGVLDLAAKRASIACDELHDAEQQWLAAKAQALHALDRELDSLRAEGQWEDRSKRAPLLKALRLLSGGKIPEGDDQPAGLVEPVEQMRSARLRRDHAELQLRNAFDCDRQEVSRRIAKLAGDRRFREAITWQNRRAVHSGIQPLTRDSADHHSNAKRRQYEEMAASYLQRYSVKNDTIGFFGPVGWAMLTDEPNAVNIAAAPELVADRNVYFEVWCIEALAKAINEISGIKQWLPPRICPFVSVEDEGIYIASKGRIELPGYQVAILRACDGRRSAKRIATHLARQHWPEVQGDQDVYDFLDLMESSGVVAWGLEAAMQLHPEKSLREQLLRIEDDSLRVRALRMLEQLEDGANHVSSAAGDPDRLDHALSNLEETFARLTGREAVRSAGQTYAARTVIYEDCRRALHLEFGREILSALAPPLNLLLAGARWFTKEAEVRARAVFDSLWSRVRAESGQGEVDLVAFMESAKPLFFDKEAGLASSIVPLFQQKWAAVLQLPSGRQRVEYSSEQLRDGVEDVFRASRPGWESACHHSPDVMIAADGVDAIRRGDFLLVMGELHLAMNTLGQNLFVAQHPSPDELQEAARCDITGPVFASVASKASTYVTGARLLPSLLCEKDYRIHCDSDSPDDRPAPLLRAGDLVVTRERDHLFVVERNGHRRFDVIEVMAELLGVAIADGFQLLAPQPHCPRVTIDRLVVSRERWSLPVGQAEFAREKTSLSRFKTVRRWARSCGLPRFSFIKLAGEDKPFYLDLDSPIYVDIFCRLLRQSMENHPESLLTATEMLPAHGQLWLPDYAGEVYASELRMVAVDLHS